MAGEEILIDIIGPAETNNNNKVEKLAASFVPNLFHAYLTVAVQWLGELHASPTMEAIREQELGKGTLFFGGPFAVAIVLGTNGVSGKALGHLVLFAVATGCPLIWSGMTQRTRYPRASAVVELAGILLVFAAYVGLVTSPLPVGLFWISILIDFLFACFAVRAMAW